MVGRRTRTHDHFNRYFFIPPSAGALLEADDLDRTMGAGSDRRGDAPQQEPLDPAHPFGAEKYTVGVPLLGFIEQNVLGVAVPQERGDRQARAAKDFGGLVLGVAKPSA